MRCVPFRRIQTGSFGQNTIWRKVQPAVLSMALDHYRQAHAECQVLSRACRLCVVVEDVSILLQLPVSPQAKQAIEEKRAGGTLPRPPAGAAPLATLLEKQLQKNYACEHSRAPRQGAAPCVSA